jgi:hypothetical protein
MPELLLLIVVALALGAVGIAMILNLFLNQDLSAVELGLNRSDLD